MGLAGFLVLIALVGWTRRREAALLERLAQLERRLLALERQSGRPDALDGASSREAAAPLAEPPVAVSPAPPPPPIVTAPATVAPGSADPPAGAASPPVAAAASDAPPAASWRPDLDVDWERLFGVRAAAVLGGATLALAGLLFFKYSVEHGLIPPWLRVLIGAIVGAGGLVGSERSWRRRYVGTANALAGAGIVILYAAAWAAGVLYDLVPLPAAFAAMVAVTVACCALAARHTSLVIALLGLAGGFATPLLVSTGADRPLGLFGYVLLLDLALLGLGRLRRWSLLAPLSLAGTLLYQTLWVGFRMGPDDLAFAFGMLLALSLAFVVALGRGDDDGDVRTRLTAAGAVLLPFAFAVYLVSRIELGGRFLPLAAYLGVLAAASCWVARRQSVRFLPLAVAGAIAGITLEWVLPREIGLTRAWELCLAAAGLAGVLHGFEVEGRRDDRADRDYGAAALALGLFVALWCGWQRTELLTPWPWVVGLGALTALLARQGAFAGRAWVQLPAAVGVVMATGLFLHHRTLFEDAPVGTTLLTGVMLGMLPFHWIARRRRDTPSHAMTEHAAGIVTAGVVMWLSPQWRTIDPPWLVLLAMCEGGVLLATVAARIRGEWQGAVWLATALATAIAHADWTALEGDRARFGLVLQSCTVVVLTAWPALRSAGFRARRLPWLVAACAGLAWIGPFRWLAERLALGVHEGWFVLALAAPALATAVWLWMRDDDALPHRTAAVAWYVAAAVAVATIAAPMLVEREWLTIAFAGEAVALALVWRQVDYPGLKWFALALTIAAGLRLIANPWVLEYHPRSTWRIVNWIALAYLVPAAATFAVAAVLHPREVGRATGIERDVLFDYELPWAALLNALVGLVLVFCWVNLEILDWFATGDTLTIDLTRLPARDLTMSVAWALYAVGLLAFGMARRSTGLRWVSLVFLLVTIAKVFLYDLGELRDLYRVASLLGLAVSLLGVSVAYQRFVFAPPPSPPATD